MAGNLAPAPIGADPGSFAWTDWYSKLTNYLNNSGSVPWSVVSKVGSNLSDLAIRAHSSLQSIMGHADGYHVSSAQYTNLALKTDPLSVFAATTSSQLAGVISDETGSGSLVFADTPTFSSATNSVVTSQGLNGIGSFKAKSSGTNLAKITFENVTTGELASISANNTGSVDFKNSAGTLVARFDATTLAAYFDKAPRSLGGMPYSGASLQANP